MQDDRPGPEDAEPSSVPLDVTSKVSQIDADDLDESLVGMLSEKVERALGNFTSDWRYDAKPEIALVLKLIIFRYTVLSPVPSSPGAKLQNLHLISERAPKKHPSRNLLLLYLLLHPPIFPTYILTRLRLYALSNQWPDLPPRDWRKKAWEAITRLENAARIWELAGWGWFLWDGKYPSLLMRLLKIRLVPSSSDVVRLVSYEFMNRQLVWSVMTEFMTMLIPMLPPRPSFLSVSGLAATMRTIFDQPTFVDYTALKPAITFKGPNEKATPAHSGILAHLPKATCPICHLRQSTAPVPLSDTRAGSNIRLPPITARDSLIQQIRGDQEHLVAQEEEAVKEETRIFVPAQSDCWGGCRWCYYCIQEEIVKHRLRLEDEKQGKGKMKDAEQQGDKWTCLRCGGGVSKAWRAGTEDRKQEQMPDLEKALPLSVDEASLV